MSTVTDLAALPPFYVPVAHILPDPFVRLEVEGLAPRWYGWAEFSWCQLACFLGDNVTRYYWEGGIDTFEIALMRALLQPGMTVLDIGGHIGYFSLLFSKAVGESGLVFTWEPDPLNYHLLGLNLDRNGANNVMTWCQALGSGEGVETLVSQAPNTGDNRLWTSDGPMHTRAHKGTRQVPVQALDEVLNPAQVVDFIKIDTQGWEPRILAGMRKTLARHDKLTLFIEYWPAGLVDSGATLQEFVEGLEGFLLLGIGDEGTLTFLGTPADLLEIGEAERYPNLLGIKGPITSTLAKLRPAIANWQRRHHPQLPVPTFGNRLGKLKIGG